MTMQRIDENTYIDDSLVTCAEYQLFIDEMREQGKYYQPDHWTSYQFPKGKAREPIVGVRYADVVEFCGWLTQQNGNEWIFRLPSQAEADKYPIKLSDDAPLGYWLSEAYQFVWIRAVPKDIIERIIAIERHHASALNLSIESDNAITIERVVAFERYLVLAVGHAIALDRAIAIISLDIDRNLSIDRNLDIDRYLDIQIDRAREIVRHLAPAEHLRTVLNVYADLFIFQERLAGRFPAYEGIRLVKYWEA